MSGKGLSLREFIEHLRGQGLAPWQLEVLSALDPENATYEEDPTMTHQDYTEQHTSQTEVASKAKPVSSRVTRYVYHVHGHASLHAPNNVEEAPARPVVPFEVVLRLRYAIDSDEAMESVRQDVRGHVVEQLHKQGSPYVVGDVMIRGVSHLHTILVDADNPEGPAARILS